MREIKFRAWHPSTQYMYAPKTLEELSMGIRTNIADGYDTLKVMQYTGLKDKNGKEIYEGDVLGTRPYGYFKKDGTRDGRYKGREWYCFAVGWGIYTAGEMGLVSGHDYDTNGAYVGWNIRVGEYDSDLDKEVIGNIYENPELLEQS
jgi:uncharacterized phage protein (TIGR01671 family)